jgi:hypothetical protein
MAGLARLGTDDPRALAEALLKIPRGEAEGPDPVRDAARALALQSPEACWQFLVRASSDDPTGLRARCEDAAGWAYERDPAAGLAFLARVAVAPPAGLGDESAGKLVAKTLEMFPRKDLPVLRDWLAKQPEGKVKQQVMATIMPRWVTEDSPSALTAIQSMPANDDDGKNRRIQSLLYNVVKGGKESLLWEDQDPRLQLLAPEDRKAVLPQLIIDRAQYAPEAALAQMTQLEGKSLTDAASAIFHRWGEYDPLQASRCLDTVPETAQPAAAESIAGEWAAKNGAAASKWVAGLPDGAVRQAAARSLSVALAPSNPQEALTWAGSLTDPSVRQETLQSVWTYVKANPGAAISILDAANLPPADKQRLRALNP